MIPQYQTLKRVAMIFFFAGILLILEDYAFWKIMDRHKRTVDYGFST